MAFAPFAFALDCCNIWIWCGYGIWKQN